MDRLIIQLSKTGDLINALPLAYAAHKSGQRVGIMTCKEFSSVLDGCSYVEPVIFDGNHWELDKAVEQAKKLCPNVVCTQTNGTKELIEKFSYEPAGQKHAVTDSFNREAYKLSGALGDWGKIPLIFDRRNQEREDALKSEFLPVNRRGPKKRVILVAVDAASSPFPYRELLMELIQLKYKNFAIVDLFKIKAERFYDLLALYESAHCLISVDTAHLHLAYAVPKLPVMALVQDSPTYWHGSAWRPSHRFHCRYSDFPKRATELFMAISQLDNERDVPFVHAYCGGLTKTSPFYTFPIQPGSCFRDSVNVLNDKCRFPMLRNVIRMFVQANGQFDTVCLTREQNKFVTGFSPIKEPCYSYCMTKPKNGDDFFFPVVDMFSAPVEFWVKIFDSVPDFVMDNGGVWSRGLVEIFKMNGAIEVEGVFRES